MCLCRGHHHGYRRRHHRHHRHRPLCSFFAATLHPADPSAGLRRTIRPAAKRHLNPRFLFSLSLLASLNLVLAPPRLPTHTTWFQGFSFIENAVRISGYIYLLFPRYRCNGPLGSKQHRESFVRLKKLNARGYARLMENSAYGTNGATEGKRFYSSNRRPRNYSVRYPALLASRGNHYR